MPDRIYDTPTDCYIREMAGREGFDAAKDDKIQRKFLVYSNHDPLVCRQAMVNQKATLNLEEFETLVLQNLSWKMHAGNDKWVFTANYGQVAKVGGYTISIDTTGGTGKQTEAYSQQKYPATGELNSRDYGTVVNVQNNNPVGVDRVLPALKIQVNARIDGSFVSSPIAYAKTVASVTGTVNNSEFLTFASGELLFLGASGNIWGENPALTFSFAASPNASGLTIGPITGITKFGHDYIWFDYKTIKDPTSNLNIAKPRAAYVSKVYTYADFSVLKIGETPP